jgi:hypothetical protein
MDSRVLNSLKKNCGDAIFKEMHHHEMGVVLRQVHIAHTLDDNGKGECTETRLWSMMMR